MGDRPRPERPRPETRDAPENVFSPASAIGLSIILAVAKPSRQLTPTRKVTEQCYSSRLIRRGATVPVEYSRHARPSDVSHLCPRRLADVARLAFSVDKARHRTLSFDHSVDVRRNVEDLGRGAHFLRLCSHDRVCAQFAAAKRPELPRLRPLAPRTDDPYSPKRKSLLRRSRVVFP